MGRLKYVVLAALVLLCVSCEPIGLLTSIKGISDSSTDPGFSDSVTFTDVTDLVLNINIPGGISIDMVTVTIDTNDATLDVADPDYFLTHDLTSTVKTPNTFTDGNYALENLGPGNSFTGVHVKLSHSAGVFTLAISKNPATIGDGEFLVTRQWTLTIEGFDSPHTVHADVVGVDNGGKLVPSYPTFGIKNVAGSGSREVGREASDRAADFTSEKETEVWDD